MPIDLALLPINGRSAARREKGVPGNFHLHEAVTLRRDAGIPFMLGHHFGLFDFNTIDLTAAKRELTDAPAGLGLVEVGMRYDLWPA